MINAVMMPGLERSYSYTSKSCLLRAKENILGACPGEVMIVCKYVCVCVFSQKASIGDILWFHSRQPGIHSKPGICPVCFIS